ncbi:2-C-methyl-D-erythritol 4-phosphate cytidylyltransferase [Flavobacteriales bacterium]|nr:2-C-methyl-D-erythritol 4-phosphate cytidylyltransferase [Flavobacteriales bacterium]
MDSFVVIVAGGSGSRMGSDIPKQFLELDSKPILMHTLERLYSITPNSNFILVLPKNQFGYWNTLCENHRFKLKHVLVEGGHSRFQSVKNGLCKISANSMVAIHDGVRPFIAKNIFENCMQEAKISGAAIPILAISDSIREISKNGSQIRDRNLFVSVQTPQCFQSDIILESYQQDFDSSFTDDASVVESKGHEISLVKGNKENIKITTPEDLNIALTFINR